MNSTRCTARGSARTSANGARPRCATRLSGISGRSVRVADDRDEPRRRGGSALAVDLRRARAARRRAERKATPAPAAPRRRRPARVAPCADREPLDCVREWFAAHGWTPFPFQQEVWRAYLAGESGLIHAATGTGKTYAALMGPILSWLADYPTRGAPRPPGGRAPPSRASPLSR